jgi:hypothetical protein
MVIFFSLITATGLSVLSIGSITIMSNQSCSMLGLLMPGYIFQLLVKLRFEGGTEY